MVGIAHRTIILDCQVNTFKRSVAKSDILRDLGGLVL